MKVGISFDIDELEEYMYLLAEHPLIEHIQIHYGANTRLKDYKWFIDKVNKLYPNISFSIHAYNEINFAEENKDVSAAWHNVARRTVDEAAIAGCIFINFHFGIYCEGNTSRQLCRKKAITGFMDLQKYTKPYNMEIHIENIYSTPPESEYQFLGDRIEDFNALLNLNSDFLLCYDFGHGNVTNLGDNFLEKNISKIKSMHVHDNDGINDLHQPIGYGNIAWNNIICLLRKADYKHYFILEHNADYYKHSLRYIEQYTP